MYSDNKPLMLITFIFPLSRLSGGGVCLARNQVEQISTEYDNVIALTISRHLFGLSADIVVIGAYLKPADSPCYNGTEVSNGVSRVYSLNVFGDHYLIVLGEANARI